MSTTPSAPTYLEVTQALNQLQSPYSAAEVHGLMSGLMCTPNEQLGAWQPLLMSQTEDPNAMESLEKLYEITSHQLSEFSFEFTLLLPEDSRDINERAEALGLWCQGFLIGLEKLGLSLKTREPSDTTEAINDLINIAQINFGDIVENDEDETAYFELVEYVRLAVLMIYHEFCLSASSHFKREKNDLLH